MSISTDARPKPAKKTKRSPRRRIPIGTAPRTTSPHQLTPIRAGDPAEPFALASSACTVLALVCGWMLLQALVLGDISEQRSQNLLYAQFRSELALATAPTGALDYNNKPIQPGSPVALLTIPQLDEQLVVVDGTASGDLRNGPGHLRSTPLPGQAGISVVMGKASTYGAPFKDIATLKKGATITVLNAEGKVSYAVQDVRRAGDPIPAAPSGASAGRLTLATAEGHGFLSALRPKTVVYIDATTDKATPAGVHAAAVPNSEQLMARDTSALPVLVLLLALLVALVLAVSVAVRRFRTALVWLVATPVAIALAWSVTDQVMRLLPNLM